MARRTKRQSNIYGQGYGNRKGRKYVQPRRVLQISGADEATIYLTIATNFNSYKDISGNDTLRSETALKEALTKDFNTMKAAHVKKYKALYDRVKLDLGKDAFASTTTDKRVELFKKQTDLHLVETYFQFGRYLLICTSQPGTQPPTLQVYGTTRCCVVGQQIYMQHQS